MSELLFGPSGRGVQEEETPVEQMAKVLSHCGLGVFEYSFGHGVRMSDAKAESIGRAFQNAGVVLSVHAPYYINLANTDPEMVEKSFGYFEQCLKKMALMGADRLVFHPGSLTGGSRAEAVERVKRNLAVLVVRLKEKGLLLPHMRLCPETMGKHGQVGTVEEVAEFCAIDECFMPTIDFGHVNAFGLGSLKTEADFKKVLDTVFFPLKDRPKELHVHMSKIEYGQKGEKRHLTFSCEGEPDYRQMILALKKYGVSARVVCESAGTQVQDSQEMQNFYKNQK